eukprot:453861_1
MSTRLIFGSIGIICCLVMCIITIYHHYAQYISSISQRKSQSSRNLKLMTLFGFDSVKMLDRLTTATAIVYILHGFGIALRSFHIYRSTIACWHAVNVSLLLFSTTKIFLYSVLIIRVDVSFGGTHHGYSRKYLIYPYLIFVCILYVIQIFRFLLKAIVIRDWAFYDAENDICISQLPAGDLLYAFVFDFTNSILCLVLFIKPIRKLLTSNSNQSHQKNNKFANLIIKYVILVSITITSSWIFTFISIFVHWWSDLWYIDNTINVFCLFGLASVHSNVYDVIFSCCHKGCLLCSGLYKFTNPMPDEIDTKSEIKDTKSVSNLSSDTDIKIQQTTSSNNINVTKSESSI